MKLDTSKNGIWVCKNVYSGVEILFVVNNNVVLKNIHLPQDIYKYKAYSGFRHSFFAPYTKYNVYFYEVSNVTVSNYKVLDYIDDIPLVVDMLFSDDEELNILSKKLIYERIK